MIGTHLRNFQVPDAERFLEISEMGTGRTAVISCEGGASMMELRKLPIKVVYVEDDASIRHMTAAYLMDRVDTVYTAENGEEALALFESENPDVLVTDIEMPGIDGLQLIRRIREHRPDIPIFVTTTFDDTVQLTEAIQQGITHYVYKQSEPSRLFQSIRDYFKFMQSGFLTLTLDADGKVREVSEPFAQYLGYRPDELVGTDVDRFVRMLGHEAAPCFSETILEDPGRENLQAVFVTKEGTERILGGSSRRVDEEGGYRLQTQWYPIDCLMRSHREISEQLEKEYYIKKLMQLHARISQEAIRSDDPDTFLQTILDSLADVDPQLSGCLLRRTDRLRLALGNGSSDIDFAELFPEPLDLEDSEKEKAYLPCYLTARHGQMVFIDNIAFLTPSPFKSRLQAHGIQTLICIPMKRDRGESYLLTLLFRRKHRFDKEELELWQNIADTMDFGLASIRLHQERDALIRRLDTLAHTDSLTGVLNRYRGVELIEHEIFRAERYDHPFAIVFFDIDNFKTINDTYGHEMGDRVLVQVTRTVEEALRKTDTLVRWGGEEFLILLPETRLNDAVHLARKLRERIENRQSAIPLPVTASFGVTEWSRGQTLDSLISRADAKMYEAKRMGRNRIAY